MASPIEVLSWVLILAGSVFVIIGGVGLLRLPDFYTRIHAAGITDTLGRLVDPHGSDAARGLYPGRRQARPCCSSSCSPPVPWRLMRWPRRRSCGVSIHSRVESSSIGTRWTTVLDLVHLVLFTFLAVVAVAIIRLKDLFAAVMLMGIFSLLSASLFTVMDAVDVAFTEAAVGAGISTILMLATLALTDSEEHPDHNRFSPLPLIAVVLTGSALVYGTFDMPRYGDPEAPIHQHVAPHYIEHTEDEIGVPEYGDGGARVVQGLRHLG